MRISPFSSADFFIRVLLLGYRLFYQETYTHTHTHTHTHSHTHTHIYIYIYIIHTYIYITINITSIQVLLLYKDVFKCNKSSASL